MPTKTIVAIDKPEHAGVVQKLYHHTEMFKIGLELATHVSNHAYGHQSLLQSVVSHPWLRVKEIFWDEKFRGIGRTVLIAVQNVIARGPQIGMISVSGENAAEGLREVAKLCRDHGVLCMGTTVLSDMSEDDCHLTYNKNTEEAAFALAVKLKECGLDGLICSGVEFPALHREAIFASGFRSLVVGLRKPGDPANGQKRISTPRKLVRNPSDFLVLGSSVTGARDPVKTLKTVRRQLHLPEHASH
ncbi:MAG: orotidine 5'-phosphate decarboxylase / HUMPS family protein [bacterium]|nr:orotidine 5'-phosphate decarboxylase / HUMPS family protein [bacterium]